MKRVMNSALWAVALGLALFAPPRGALAQTPSPAATASQPGGDPAATPDKPPMKPEEIEQVVAPVALYDDNLLAQVLMASTYPVEVVQADRWLKGKGGAVKDDATAKELDGQTWDASVKSLCNVPQVLTMMSEKLDWTVKLGDAFLENQKGVMDAVQKLRGKASAEGNLKSNENQKVSAENTGGTTTYIIQQSDPEVIYVPTYTPTVYGAWAYPSYPPYYYYPPGYVAHPGLAFGAGVACGLAWGYAMGNCNWGGGDVDIDINKNVNRNKNIDRTKMQNNANRSGAAGSNGKGSWKHDSAHRQGASYRNQSTASKVGASNRGPSNASRDSFKGRTDAGAGNRPSAGTSNRGGAGAGNRPSAGTSDRGGAGAGAGNRSGFSGSSGSGSAARSNSSRGSSSLGSGGGASRSSGGASRGGGSRGGGGRGGGGRR